MEELAISGPSTVLESKPNSERCTEIFSHTKVIDGPSSLLPAFSTSSSATGSTLNYSRNDQEKVNRTAEDQLLKSLTEAANSCGIDSIDSVSHPSEMALSIDLILKKILGSLKGRDLFKCRLVSRHWNSAATSQIQKQLKFRLHIFETKTLEQFVVLLMQHSPGGILFWSPFPSSKFIFHNCCTLENELLREALTLQGAHITDIELTFLELRRHQADIPTEALLMEKIYNLIIFQVPNLHRLKLNAMCKVDWKIKHNEYGTLSLPRGFHSPLLKTDPEFLEVHSKYDPALNRYAKVHRKLKVLDVSSHYNSAKILEMIILLAPNLEQIVANKDCQVYVLQPLDRLHLPKKLWFKQHIAYFMRDHSDHVTPYERIAEASEEGRLKLREITVSYPCSHYTRKSRSVTPCVFPSDGPYDRTARIINVLCRILEGCKNSLEVIEWDAYSSVSPGHGSYVSASGELDEGVEFKFPEVMPKVRKARFQYPPNLLGEDGFPSLTLWPRIFPNLKTLGLCEVELDWEMVNTRAPMNITKLLQAPPNETLREILIHTSKVIKEEEMNLFKKIFPNATVVVTDVRECAYFR